MRAYVTFRPPAPDSAGVRNDCQTLITNIIKTNPAEPGLPATNNCRIGIELMHYQHLLAQQAAMPNMDGTFWLMLLSRILHILGAIVLVGGLFYIRNII